MTLKQLLDVYAVDVTESPAWSAHCLLFFAANVNNPDYDILEPPEAGLRVCNRPDCILWSASGPTGKSTVVVSKPNGLRSEIYYSVVPSSELATWESFGAIATVFAKTQARLEYLGDVDQHSPLSFYVAPF